MAHAPAPLRRAVQRAAGSRWFAKVGPHVVPPLDRLTGRLTGGRWLLSRGMVPSLLLSTTGARSGVVRTTPLACLPEPDGTWLVVGSNFGKPGHPAWTHNLLAHPEATVAFEGTSTPVRAALVEGPERAEAWARLLDLWPVFQTYTDRSGRHLRVFRLTPT